jgi:uncharacterized membrane protein
MSNPRSTAKIFGHPIHPMIVPFPIASFVGVLLCDLALWRTMDPMWFLASKWLLCVGIVTALLAAVAGFTDFLGDQRIRDLGIARLHMGGNLAVVLIEAFNWYKRYPGNADVVFSSGLLLSAAAVGLMLVTGWLGGEMVFRRRVGVADSEL